MPEANRSLARANREQRRAPTLRSRTQPRRRRSRGASGSPAELVLERLELADWDERHEAQEDQEQKQEKGQRSKQQRAIDERRSITVADGRQEVRAQGGDDQHQTLEPHPELNRQRQSKQTQRALPHAAAPQEQRGAAVAGDDGP